MTASIVGLVVAGLIVLMGAASVRVIREYERGVVFRLGRLRPAAGPGLCRVVPGLERLVRVAVERAEPNADHLGVDGAAAPERRAAVRAELLEEAAVAGVVRADELLAGQQSERAGRDPCRRGGGGAGAALAPRAVAVAGRDERLVDLEAHAAAEAAAGERRHDALCRFR